ncbi:protein MAIN-LIKE 1-like [Vigna umbellata]|uniref:protein MAIN-LIKE 1-like n=1 Tax=Vigna umbellata TaxID=87088 RepID=UPI001F5F93F2|nr:protein MAIN-LIKE 1-like [Vigna umbellata]
MARTKGASSYCGEASSSSGEPSSSSDERRRLTTSARRRHVEEYRVDVIDEHDHEEQEEFIHHEHGEDDYVEHEDVQQQDNSSEEEHEDEDEDGGFPGGPHDTSLLTQHVAFVIWGIKVISHGKKLKHFGMYHEVIEPYISMLGLCSLVNLSYEYVDHRLIVALSEKNIFHLSIGEMSVTLDDVLNQLHLPIMDQFCEVEELEYDEKQSHGPKVRLSWLHKVYQECIEQERSECAARAYLLHLLGCTIFYK